MSNYFSLKLTDLDDFIAPSQECIKPVQKPKKDESQSGQKSKIKIELDDPNFNYVEEPSKPVQINLTDCLACSGCITSAESVLIQQQSPDEILKYLQKNKELQSKGEKSLGIVSLGVQAILSVAEKFNVSEQDAAEHLTGMFKSFGADKVTVITVAENISLLESRNEFLNCLEKEQERLPLITGICPGWVCYAEKLHPYALPHISKVKSAQQIMGGLIKLIYGPKEGYSPDQIYHISLMSCFDRKLESSRKDFELEDYRSKEVDVVISPVEVEQIFQTQNKTLTDFPKIPLDDLFGRGSHVMRHLGSGSGGLAEFILRSSGNFSSDESVNWELGRNLDISTCSTLKDGKELKFSIATGFRNIQTIVRKLKLKNKQGLPHYIEMMACPTGCLNGGAQSRPVDLLGRDLAIKLEKEYNNLPLEKDFEDILDLFPILKDDKTLYNQIAYTDFHAIEKTINLGIKW